MFQLETYSTYSGRKLITLNGWDTINQNKGCWKLVAWTDSTRKVQ